MLIPIATLALLFINPYQYIEKIIIDIKNRELSKDLKLSETKGEIFGSIKLVGLWIIEFTQFALQITTSFLLGVYISEWMNLSTMFLPLPTFVLVIFPIFLLTGKYGSLVNYLLESENGKYFFPIMNTIIVLQSITLLGFSLT